MAKVMAGAPPSLARDIRLVDAVHAVRERIRFVLSLAAAIFLTMAVLILTDAPAYRAYVTLAPSPPLIDPSPTSFDDSLFGMDDPGNIGVFQAQTSPNHAFALLRSKAISRRFIKANNLLPILFADQWDSEKQTWRDPEIDRQPTLSDALELFESEVRFMSKNPNTGFIRINIEWSDPELAANWANGLVDMTDSAIRERDIDEARQSIRFLQERVASATLEPVRQLMYKLIESHAKTIMVANIKENYVFTVIDPAVTLQADDTINMPASFKLSLALIFAFSCGALWVIIAAQFNKRSG